MVSDEKPLLPLGIASKHGNLKPIKCFRARSVPDSLLLVLVGLVQHEDCRVAFLPPDETAWLARIQMDFVAVSLLQGTLWHELSP